MQKQNPARAARPLSDAFARRRTWPTAALLAIAAVLYGSCAPAQDCHSLNDVQWLLGEWRAVSADTIVVERWRRASPLTFEGSGETRVAETDEIRSTEWLRLVEMGGEVFYLAKVAHNPLPVAFRLTRCSASEAVFENDAHDFPTRLAYALESVNRLTVFVSDGADSGFAIHFARQASAP